MNIKIKKNDTWHSFGTLKYLKINTKTKRLSTDKLFSNRYLKGKSIKAIDNFDEVKLLIH